MLYWLIRKKLQLSYLRVVAVHESFAKRHQISSFIWRSSKWKQIRQPAKLGALLAKNVKCIQEHVRFRSFREGGFGPSRRITNDVHKKKGKLKRNWEEPFMPEKVFLNVAYLLTSMEGDRLIPSINPVSKGNITHNEVSVLVISPKVLSKGSG